MKRCRLIEVSETFNELRGIWRKGRYECGQKITAHHTSCHPDEGFALTWKWWMARLHHWRTCRGKR